MEKKLSFTDQALNQIDKITVGEDKKYFSCYCSDDWVWLPAFK